MKTQAQLIEATVLDIWLPKWFKTPVSKSHLKKDLSSGRLLVGGKYPLELENLTVSFTGFSFSIFLNVWKLHSVGLGGKVNLCFTSLQFPERVICFQAAEK